MAQQNHGTREECEATVIKLVLGTSMPSVHSNGMELFSLLTIFNHFVCLGGKN